MKNVLFHRLARQEFREAVERYEEERRGPGQEFVDEVEHAITLLQQFPELGRQVNATLRRFILPRFPYYLIYRSIGNDRLRILAIGHHRRRPEYCVARE